MDPDTGGWMVANDDGSLSFSGMLKGYSNLNGPLLLIKDESMMCLKDFMLWKVTLKRTLSIPSVCLWE